MALDIYRYLQYISKGKDKNLGNKESVDNEVYVHVLFENC